MTTTNDYQPGLPIDRRGETQVQRAKASTVGDFEGMAARVVARYLGVEVALVDDGSADSMVDIRIRHLDGLVGVVEVVIDTSERMAATYNEVRKKAFRIETPQLERRWQLRLDRSCDLRVLEERGLDLLGRLEAAGITFDEFVPDAFAFTESEVVADLRAIGVANATSRLLQTGEQRFAQLVPEGTGGYPEDSWEGFHAELARILYDDRLGGRPRQTCGQRCRRASRLPRHLVLE